MDGIKCSFQILQQLKTLAVAAFGKPSTWTEPQVADLGNILGKIISANKKKTPLEYFIEIPVKCHLGEKLAFTFGNVFICVPKLGWMHRSWLLWTHLSFHLSAGRVSHSSLQTILL